MKNKIIFLVLVGFVAVAVADENAQVGPNKGILEASEHDGIKLSAEAEKSFSIQRVQLSSSGHPEIPRLAIVTALSEVNVYRYRSGFYKRIDLSEVKPGDEIVVQGMGFLRLAELSAFGGAAEGHSH